MPDDWQEDGFIRIQQRMDWSRSRRFYSDSIQGMFAAEAANSETFHEVTNIITAKSLKADTTLTEEEDTQ